jgi:hypothetical protein
MLFLDDAAQKNCSRERVGKLVAIGGIAIEASECRTLERAIDDLCRTTYGFPGGAPFKWSPSRDHWMRDNLVGDRREQFFNEVLKLAAQHNVVGLAAVSDATKGLAVPKAKLLKKANVMTFADFTKSAEADIEDMFGAEFYVDLVNAEFESQLAAPIDLKALKSKEPRILQRLEKYFEEYPFKEGSFSHYRPARYFSENSKKLVKKLPKEAKDSFEAAFKALNALLK